MHTDEQVGQVLDRLAPVADNVRVLTQSGAVTAVLQIVRFFSDTPSSPVPTTILVGEDGAFEGPMPHHLLGWSLSAERLALLSSIGASIDCDEHDG